MKHPAYPSAPITEAVIEIKFSSPLDSDAIAKVSERYRDNYPQHSPVQTYTLNVDIAAGQVGAPKAAFDEEKGFRLASTDMTELLVVWRSAFVSSQLAPYPGWDTFFDRFVRDWKVWKRSMGFREISRLGVRYINRIDIPVDGPIVEQEDFLNVYAKTPDILGDMAAYAVQAVFPVREIDCKLTLNSALVDSPILGHASFLVDQDIAKEVNPPQSDEDIFSLLNAIRIQKNKIFESCVTDRARELFQR